MKDALEVDQIFDSISYLKGSSVLRMLADHLGQEIFLRGVSSYLKAHAFSNAKVSPISLNCYWRAWAKNLPGRGCMPLSE